LYRASLPMSCEEAMREQRGPRGQRARKRPGRLRRGKVTRLLEDILREPAALRRCLRGLTGTSQDAISQAAALLRDASRVLVVGIGSSWNAGTSVNHALARAGVAACLYDASELQHFGPFPKGAAVLMLSRSGRSVEIVRLVDRIRESQSAIVAVTNTPDSPLAIAADATVFLDSGFDHLVSVVMYSGLVLGGGLIAASVAAFPGSMSLELASALERVENNISTWRQCIEESNWLDSKAPTCFLARGPSLATAHEARLLWEEAAKMPASSLTTGGFRHGSQEMVWPGTRIALWIDPVSQRKEDLQLAADLRRAGAHVFAVGQDLPEDAADLVINLPAIPAGWQSLVDIIPAQLAAERLARLRGQDCDAFRFCPYIIEEEGGLGAPSGDNGRAVRT
jgi:glucosamine--fructose-6-phosphate aminotransferase (isomerizing)